MNKNLLVLCTNLQNSWVHVIVSTHLSETRYQSLDAFAYKKSGFWPFVAFLVYVVCMAFSIWDSPFGTNTRQSFAAGVVDAVA